MNINAIIIGASILLVLLGFVIGYLLGWRSGHLTGIDYALRLWVHGVKPVPVDEVAEFTQEVAEENRARLKTVKEETLAQIEELRNSGVK